MSKHSNRLCSISHGRSSYEKIVSIDDGLLRKSSRKIKGASFTNFQVKSTKRHEQRNENQSCNIFKVLLILLCVLSLSYQSVRNDRMIYGILENGASTYGYASHHKKEGTIVTMTLGYTFPRSIVYTVASLMLVYSLISGKSYWILPLLFIFLADIVCNVSEAILTIILFFRKLHFTTACYYTIAVVLLIAGEIQVTLEILNLYEGNVLYKQQNKTK